MPIPTKKHIKKYFDRGQYAMIYSEDMVIVCWNANNNKPVYFLSNSHGEDMVIISWKENKPVHVLINSHKPDPTIAMK